MHYAVLASCRLSPSSMTDMYLELVLEELHVIPAGEQGYKLLEQALSRLLAVLWTRSCTKAASLPHNAVTVPHHFVKQRFLGGVPGLIILHMAMVGMMCPVADTPACSMQSRSRLRFAILRRPQPRFGSGRQLPAGPPPPHPPAPGCAGSCRRPATTTRTAACAVASQAEACQTEAGVKVTAPTPCGAELMLRTVLDAERQVPTVFKLSLSLASHSHHGKAPECWSG